MSAVLGFTVLIALCVGIFLAVPLLVAPIVLLYTYHTRPRAELGAAQASAEPHTVASSTSLRSATPASSQVVTAA